MTQVQARRILGISSSAGATPAERIYQTKCREAQRRLMPGNTRSERQKAQAELLKLTTAWHTLDFNTSKRPKPPKRKRTAAPRPTRQARHPNSKPGLADVWDDLFAALPFQKPLVVAVFGAMVIVVVISLFKHL